MGFIELPTNTWHEFFEGISEVIRGKLLELEVVGLDLGDQIVGAWLSVDGMTYEPVEDVLYVYTGPAESVDHAIWHPREIFVELGPAGVSQVVVIDADDHKQFMRLRTPLELPATNPASQIAQPKGLR